MIISRLPRGKPCSAFGLSGSDRKPNLHKHKKFTVFLHFNMCLSEKILAK